MSSRTVDRAIEVSFIPSSAEASIIAYARAVGGEGAATPFVVRAAARYAVRGGAEDWMASSRPEADAPADDDLEARDERLAALRRRREAAQ